MRFYKAFNHDYLRKIDSVAQSNAKPWDKIDGRFYPFVRIELDPKVTTIVGANESGKSQLLSAIEKALLGQGIMDEDLCRYSPSFTVQQSKMRLPDFGLEWHNLTPADKERVKVVLNAPKESSFDTLHLFRNNGGVLQGYLPGSANAIQLSKEQAASILPRSFTINSKIALPDSVPIAALIRINQGAAPELTQALDRRRRGELVEALCAQGGAFVGTLRAFAGSKEGTSPDQRSILSVLADLLAPSAAMSELDRTHAEAQARLAHDLLFKVAKIDRRALENLSKALRQGSDGFASAICDEINLQMAARLNFPRFWVQDSHFALLVTPREHELVFTIRDRTGRQYTFNERSGGLKFFLSYYIQYLAHEPSDLETEILLMDEPDAYLSSQAQQDLLRVFNAFAEGEGGRKPVQVVYVTHSPFLIDKNHGERIRVLEKGAGDEGTRVVNRGSRNHYEPLRSSFGAFFAETASIGNCNLIVEGPSDQILLAAGAHYLRHLGTPTLENLDLNRLTILPAGGASNVPYTVYLAKGRGGTEHPAVIVLLDSDTAGDNACKSLGREPIRGKRLLDPKFILQVGDLGQEAGIVADRGSSLIEIEDLVPLSLCVPVTKRYAKSFWALEPTHIEQITHAAVSVHFTDAKSIFDAIAATTVGLFGADFSIDKVGFARLIADLLSGREIMEWVDDEGACAEIQQGLDQFRKNMRALFQVLTSRQRMAETELTIERVSTKVERIKKRFLQDYAGGTTREQARLVLKEIFDALDPSQEGDQARTLLDAIKRDAKLDEDALEPVADFSKFSEDLQRVRYASTDK